MGNSIQQEQQAAPVVERLGVERRESGSGRSMRVSYVLTVDYANRPQYVTGEMSIKGLHSNMNAARVPEPIAAQLARYAGSVYLVEGRWTMVHPAGEGARLAAEVTRDEVEEAHRRALSRFAEFTGGTLRGKPATEALVWEFTEARREAHRLERIGQAEEGWAAYHRAGALLEAARRFELEDAEEASEAEEEQAADAATAPGKVVRYLSPLEVYNKRNALEGAQVGRAYWVNANLGAAEVERTATEANADAYGFSLGTLDRVEPGPHAFTLIMADGKREELTSYDVVCVVRTLGAELVRCEAHEGVHAEELFCEYPHNMGRYAD